MIKLPRVADPPVVIGKMKDRFCKFHRAVGYDTENCFVLKNIIQDYIDKNLLVEGVENEKMTILNQPFLQHSAAVIFDQPFQPQDHIQPCPSSDINIQHQVLVLHQAQSNTQKMDLISAFSKLNVSPEPARTSPEVARRIPGFP